MPLKHHTMTDFEYIIFNIELPFVLSTSSYLDWTSTVDSPRIIHKCTVFTLIFDWFLIISDLLQDKWFVTTYQIVQTYPTLYKIKWNTSVYMIKINDIQTFSSSMTYIMLHVYQHFQVQSSIKSQCLKSSTLLAFQSLSFHSNAYNFLLCTKITMNY